MPISIAIIGAGPGGLTLARLLQVHLISCTVFESEASRTVRNQGGTLDLHPRAGQRALKEAGLFEEFQKHARPEAECAKLMKFDGTVLWDENVMGNTRPQEFADRPEIDRVVLRDILLDSIAPNTIHWGRKLDRVEADPRIKEKYNLYFTNGIVERGFDLVVGADGAWSKVRALLTDEKPFYSGITAIELWAIEVDTKNPSLAEFNGKGSMFMFDEGRAIICQRNGNGSIRAYAGLRVPETWLEDCGIDWTSPDARKLLVERYFADCHLDLKRVILESSEELIPRKMSMLPVGVAWESCPGITLLGDAAHLMTPFAGVGVNLAMADALHLAHALVQRKDSFVAKVFGDSGNIAATVEGYEKEMWKRGREYAQKTKDNMMLHFSAEGGEERAGKMRKHYEMSNAAKD